MRGGSWFRVLGPVRAGRDDAEADLGTPQQRVVLAVLVAGAGGPVAAATIADVLWRDDPPRSASSTIQQYVSRLRRALGTPDVIRRVRGGYRLDGDDLDVLTWRGLVAGGRAGEALRVWSGPVAADLPAESREHPVFAGLAREHAAVLCAAADQALASGRAGELTGALQLAVTWYPYDEAVHARLIRVLAATGRRADALRHFHTVREALTGELGVEPGKLLQDAHRLVLADPEPSPAESRQEPVPGGPAMLPADPRTFSGRTAEIEQLDALMTGDRPLTVVTGLGGAGKTTLALRWAHRRVADFPDGQLYVDLRGFAPGNVPVEPAEALHTLLEALGVARANQPSSLAELAALYRTRLDGRRVLVVLDNARDDEQARPLLPAAAGCAVVVTSRSHLGGLVVEDGARSMGLDLFSGAEARAYLRSLLGARVDAEPDATAVIAEVCGGLPLALALCVAWARRHPGFALADVAAELRQRDGLDAFTGVAAGRDVRAVFSWSYQGLGVEAAELFRALGAHPGPDVAATTVRSVAGLDRAGTLRLLTELLDAQLVSEVQPGRYAMHDLVRAYAIELGDPRERQRTLRRVVDHYLHTLIGCAMTVAPHRAPVDAGTPAPGVTAWTPSGREQALAWFAAEHDNLLAAFDAAERAGADAPLWLTCWAFDSFLTATLGRSDETPSLVRRALAAAERAGEVWWRGYLHHALASWHYQRGDHPEALRQLETTAAIGRAAGDPIRTAGALVHIATALVDPGGWPSGEQIERAGALADEAVVLCVRVLDGVAAATEADRVRARQILGDTYSFTALRVLHRTGDLAAAEAELGNGLRIHGNAPYLTVWLLENMARFRSRLGDDAAAVRTYEQAIALGDDAWATTAMLTAVAECHARLGDPDRLAEVRDRVLRDLDGVYHSNAAGLRARLAALTTTATA
ncbi:SARP family transcriptional regulator [Actinoplanes philippinensis]|uniref:DNA-binding transcriptional activator of the SARP family n=1 Tax=Actinoplanes philippinensis TaxID=35752 RepID=A0A1I2HGV4_9ACTN|nr:BTAD domain-containing putative transcriptional regulator [Actinoplanes philippinensis]GIE81757.1 SARP family transcriptional regulator [Actinoplanes philippinensis]SFF28540.1 DNA-binding transcriptional activator of the SARP family [Actinoplanes philippinensis]